MPFEKGHRFFQEIECWPLVHLFINEIISAIRFIANRPQSCLRMAQCNTLAKQHICSIGQLTESGQSQVCKYGFRVVSLFKPIPSAILCPAYRLIQQFTIKIVNGKADSSATFPALGFAGLPNHHIAHCRSVGRLDIFPFLDVNCSVENIGAVRAFWYIHRNDLASLNIIQSNGEQYLRGNMFMQEDTECFSIFFAWFAEYLAMIIDTDQNAAAFGVEQSTHGTAN